MSGSLLAMIFVRTLFDTAPLLIASHSLGVIFIFRSLREADPTVARALVIALWEAFLMMSLSSVTALTALTSRLAIRNAWRSLGAFLRAVFNLLVRVSTS